MKLRTEIQLPKASIQFEHHHNILSIGSCFAENIAEYFRSYRFNIFPNPFGVLYNPISIYNSFNLLTQNKIFSKEDLVYHQNEWHSFYHHSDFSNHDFNVCLENINDKLEETRKFLFKCDRIIITYGTSFVYGHKKKGIVVSNCHKIPAEEFIRYRLSIDKTMEVLGLTVELLKSFNSDIKIILTVSPVRHWKDGAVENQLSKSILLFALSEIVGKNEDYFYFPSFEIMMDDLRDYRFYASDLVHPNKIATDYIWGKFSQSHLSDECFEIMKETIKIENARNHRPRNPKSETHQIFVNEQINFINRLLKKYPHINLKDDLEYFSKQ